MVRVNLDRPWVRTDLLKVETATIRDRAKHIERDATVTLYARGPLGPFLAKVEQPDAPEYVVGPYVAAYTAACSALGRVEEMTRTEEQDIRERAAAYLWAAYPPRRPLRDRQPRSSARRPTCAPGRGGPAARHRPSRG